MNVIVSRFFLVSGVTVSLQAARARSDPNLLRVDYEAEHGTGSTKTGLENELAAEWNFLPWQLGTI